VSSPSAFPATPQHEAHEDPERGDRETEHVASALVEHRQRQAPPTEKMRETEAPAAS
jgi:hypothetical protein